MCVLNSMLLVRRIHSGHVKRVLNAKRGPFHKKFEKIIADQRERPDYELKNVKYEKDTMARELAMEKRELVGLFSLEQATKMVDSKQEKMKSKMIVVNEARRIYQILRPEAPSFFEEQTSIHLKRSMDKLLSKNKEDSKEIVPIDEVIENLNKTLIQEEVISQQNPVFTESSYSLSVISLLESLAEDIHSFCEYLEIKELPKKSYNYLPEMFEKMESFFKLKKDGTNVEEWMAKVWKKFRNFFIDDLKEISEEEMSEWLKLHLNRVSNNLKALDKPVEEWYKFSEDILYDSIPFSNQLEIENKIGFPIEKASKYLTLLLSLFKEVKVDRVEELIECLKGLGLKNWFNLLPNEIETSLFGIQKPVEKLKFKKEDLDLSYVVIETMARNLEYLLEIETYSPNLVLCNISKNLKLNLFEVEENKWLTSEDIKKMINKVYSEKIDSNELEELIDTPLKQMLMDEDEYTNKVGSLELLKKKKDSGKKEKEQEWKWVVPSVDTIFDSNRNIYIRNKSNLDPLMRLENLKCFILSKSRMRSMTKEGRVYFLRVIVAIGDGNGYFGIGIGYGNDLNSAKNNGIENGLKNMFFLDYDPFETLTTPVLGKEYSSRCLIKSIYKGIRCNNKFLPLVYLIGLNNVKFRLKGKKTWVSRIKAIRKALESIISRRTICNMLGKRYSYYANPSDYTVHWSDSWFNPILKEYLVKMNKLKKLRLKFSRRNRMKHSILLPTDVTNYVPHYSRSLVPQTGTQDTNLLDRLNKTFNF